MGKSPRVKCVVNTCTHYMSGDVCAADNIHIWHEQQGRMSQAKKETECKSFHKNENLLDMVGAMHNVDVGGMATAPFLDGQQLSPGVKCIVSTCAYWDNGDYCVADAIEISGRDARECGDTDCRTFEMSKQGQRASSEVRIGWDDKFKKKE
ncbi:MAG: DUF1540 domain-containing protein [Bacillota bacterium]